MKKTTEVVMIRHAQSEFNAQGRFSGWADPPLSQAGVDEARRAGDFLAKSNYKFDYVYSSRLSRAIQTADLIMQHMGYANFPIVQDWRLNERHYGDLQGRIRQQLIDRVGEEQVWRWRRGYEDMPPSLSATDLRHSKYDPRYKDLAAKDVPSAESLRDTRLRVAKFWQELVEPKLQSKDRLLLVAHGNTLRALLMELTGMSVEDVEKFEVPTGIPIVCSINSGKQAVTWRYLQASAA